MQNTSLVLQQKCVSHYNFQMVIIIDTANNKWFCNLEGKVEITKDDYAIEQLEQNVIGIVRFEGH